MFHKIGLMVVSLCQLCVVNEASAQSTAENKKPTLQVASLDPETKKWLDQMNRLASGRTPTAQTWAEASSQLQSALAEFIDRAEKDGGYVVVGQLKVPGKVDPRSVASPCQILPGGYFVTRVLEKGSSVPFALHGCASLDAKTSGDSIVENVGLITMKSLPRPKTVTVTGSIVLEEHQNAPKHDQIQIEWQIVTPPTNGTMENHQQEVSREEFLLPSVVTKVGRDGKFKALGLSPGLYHAVVSAPGCQRVAHYINLSNTSGIHEIDPIELGVVKTFTNSVGMEFVWIPPGKFVMGRCVRFGTPDHFVIITKGFWMGKAEVTRGQFEAMMGKFPTAHVYAYETDQHAMVSASIESGTSMKTLAQQFIAKLTTETKGSADYRLPTEAEWEYACRAATTTLAFCPQEEIQRFAHSARSQQSDNSIRRSPVGQKLPNPWGLYDIYGNVIELCQDIWTERYDLTQLPRIDPCVTTGSQYQVLRGGSQLFWPSAMNSSLRRGQTSPGVVRDHHTVHLTEEIGFRLVYIPQD